MTSSNGNIFRVTGPLCGEFTGPGEFPTQRPVTRSFDDFFDIINDWVNNREAGDVRRYRGHYDVIVMFFGIVSLALGQLYHWLSVSEATLNSIVKLTGPRLNIKTIFPCMGISNMKMKDLYNGNPYTGKTPYLYRDRLFRMTDVIYMTSTCISDTSSSVIIHIKTVHKVLPREVILWQSRKSVAVIS